MLTEKLVEDFLRPYSPAQVSMLHTLALEMQTFSMTAEDIIEICENHLSAIITDAPQYPSERPSDKWLHGICPNCGQPLGKMVVENEKIIFCRSCRWSKLGV